MDLLGLLGLLGLVDLTGFPGIKGNFIFFPEIFPILNSEFFKSFRR